VAENLSAWLCSGTIPDRKMSEVSETLLASDLAGPVFKLLFDFGRDEIFDGKEDFESELFEIFPKSHLPQPVKKRLEAIFYESRLSKTSAAELASEVKDATGNDRQAIVSICELLLSRVVTDGILCRKASSKFEQIAEVFRLTDEEVMGLSEPLQDVLSLIYGINNEYRNYSSDCSELSELYRTLECEPNCSDNELRGAYRKLVKKLHPDSSEQNDKQVSKRFLEVQGAFEKIALHRQHKQNPA